jgi:hypothetical protein
MLAFRGGQSRLVCDRMSALRKGLIAAACIVPLAALACRRAPDDRDDVAKATGKAKDIGHATIELADKAGQRLEDATSKAAVGGEDAWITTKVKTALTSEGFDVLHVHVDTDGKVVTLSGTVESAAKREKAVQLAKGVTGVVGVKDHLFVNTEK